MRETGGHSNVWPRTGGDHNTLRSEELLYPSQCQEQAIALTRFASESSQSGGAQPYGAARLQRESPPDSKPSANKVIGSP